MKQKKSATGLLHGTLYEETLFFKPQNLMENQPFSAILESLQNDVAQVGGHLREISRRVIEEGISDYPVFVAAQEIVDIGKPIFDRDSMPLNWFFSASILEDFVRKKIVLKENLQQFRRTFGDPMKKACIFVVTRDEARFVFVPFEEEEEKTDPTAK
ncbi:MAG: hypothetical protein D6730_04345 [Bacteroidetes bacterium]|nr:MAG: hypothetical protein D6730_04345 [Bacteroidota bacterium]